MVLPLTHAKIIVEAEGHRYQFDAPTADIGSTDFGQTHFLRTGPLHNKTKNLISEKETPVIDNTPITEAPRSPEHEAALKAVKQAAQRIEHQQLASAHIIEQAYREAQQDSDVVSHRFHMTVLEALHAGLTQEEIEKHLFDAGFNQLEEKVDSVRTLDTDLLYDGGL